MSSARVLHPQGELTEREIVRGSQCELRLPRKRDGEIIDKSCNRSQEQSDRPDTFSRFTPHSWLLSEQIRSFQAVLKPRSRAGGRVVSGPREEPLS